MQGKENGREVEEKGRERNHRRINFPILLYVVLSIVCPFAPVVFSVGLELEGEDGPGKKKADKATLSRHEKAVEKLRFIQADASIIKGDKHMVSGVAVTSLGFTIQLVLRSYTYVHVRTRTYTMCTFVHSTCT